MRVRLRDWPVFVLALGLTPPAFCDYIVPTYEPAGVEWPQAAAICGGTTICVLGTETFDSWHGGGFTTDFGTGGQITGTYSGGIMDYSADKFGGADGTGSYPVVFSSGGYYSITLDTPGALPGVNYFGLWYSALDAGNLLRFYRSGELLDSFTPADFIALVGPCGASNPFCGNPNPQFQGQNSGQLYAYLNFFDTDGYFDEVEFSETGGGGFESDNHTVAYLNPPEISGDLIYNPEPATACLWAIAAALLFFRTLHHRS